MKYSYTMTDLLYEKNSTRLLLVDRTRRRTGETDYLTEDSFRGNARGALIEAGYEPDHKNATTFHMLVNAITRDAWYAYMEKKPYTFFEIDLTIMRFENEQFDLSSATDEEMKKIAEFMTTFIGETDEETFRLSLEEACFQIGLPEREQNEIN